MWVNALKEGKFACTLGPHTTFSLIPTNSLQQKTDASQTQRIPCRHAALSQTAAASPTFKPSVTVIILRAGHLDEPAWQDLATVSQDLSDAIITPQTAPEQWPSKHGTGPQDGGFQPLPLHLPRGPDTLRAEDRTQQPSPKGTRVLKMDHDGQEPHT